MGILSVLSKKKKEEPVILSVETLIFGIVKKNIEKITGKVPVTEINQVKFANWQIYLTDIKSGYVLRFFRDSIRSPFLVFFPIGFISKYLPSVSKKNLQSELLKFMGLIPSCLLLGIESETGLPISAGENISLPDSLFSELKEKDEVFWQTSGSRIFNIKLGSESIYLVLAEDEVQKFNSHCLKSGITVGQIEDLTKIASSGNSFEIIKENDNITELNEISNKAEFLLGRFFLPRETLIGGHNAVSEFDTLGFNPENTGKEGGIHFSLNFSIDEKVHSIIYSIPAKGASGASLSKMMQHLIKAVLPMWKRFFKIRNVSGGKTDISSKTNISAKALLSGKIKYQNSKISIRVGLSRDIISLLSNRFSESEEFINSDFARFISLNSKLLNIFLKDNLFPPMTLSEFFNLIDDIDLKRIVQNYFSGTGWNSETMQPLFTYSRKIIEKKKICSEPAGWINR